MILGSDSEVLDIGRKTRTIPQRFDEDWNNVTLAPPGRGTPHLLRGRMLTISSTGPMAETLPSTTSCSCATDTTPPHTRARALVIAEGEHGRVQPTP
jgi:hypothetical protein